MRVNGRGHHDHSYRFLDSSILLELAAQAEIVCMPCKASVHQLASESFLAGILYPMKSLAIEFPAYDVVVSHRILALSRYDALTDVQSIKY